MSENNTAIAKRPSKLLGLDMKDLSEVAALIFNSHVYGDIQTKEAAAIKIVAGMEYGFNPFQSMSMIDFIQGRPTLNAHGKATLINSSGDFRLKIKTLTPQLCEIEVCRKNAEGQWKIVNTNSFSIEDAKQAELTNGKNAHSWKKYPRNMLFARCVSNIWRWDCAELNLRRFSPDQIQEFEADELDETPDVQDEQTAQPVEEVPTDRIDEGNEPEVIDGEPVERTREDCIVEVKRLCQQLNKAGDSIKWTAPNLTNYINDLFSVNDGIDALSFDSFDTLIGDLEGRLQTLTEQV